MKSLSPSICVCLGGACSAILVACSSSKEPATTGVHEEVRPANSPASLVSSGTGAAAGVGWPDFSYAVTLPMAPWTECAVSPLPGGTSTGSSRSGILQAGPDGEVRFYAPPPAWGTRLKLDCALNGSLQGSYVVDLNDSTSFQKKSAADLESHVVGVRPALTGDLSSIPLNTLLAQGYPPRPDPVANPPRYAEWLKSVSAPVDVYDSVFVTRLGVTAGTYQGTNPPATDVGPTTTNNGAWAGFVQTPQGFSNGAANVNLTPFCAYWSEMTAPSGVTCTQGCNSGIWSGIGGFGTNSLFGGQFVPELIQSGFNLTGTNRAPLFTEYTPGFVQLPTYPAADRTAPGDQFYVIAYASPDGTCNNIEADGGALFACFEFQNLTQGWFIGPQTAGTTKLIIKQTNNTTFIGSTAEWIAEWVSQQNPQFSANQMPWASAYDIGGSWHGDPSSGGDAYTAFWTTDSSSQFANIALFSNLTVNTPQDPMEFVWENSQ
jgi:hypothetical protein